MLIVAFPGNFGPRAHVLGSMTDRGDTPATTGDGDGETTVTIGNTMDWRGVVTFVSDLEKTIQMLRGAIDGDVCSRSRVVDGLLDLRLEAERRPDMTELVDAALADVPGRTVVPSDWWRHQLDLLEMAAINPVEPVG